MRQLVINDIVIEVEKKKIKNMYLRVLPPNGLVHISAPILMSEEEIKRFILNKIDWIEKQQRKIQKRNLYEELEYKTGEEVYYRGKKFTLRIVPAVRRSKISQDGDFLILSAPTNSSFVQRANILTKWYREMLKQEIPPLITKWETIIGVKSNSFCIRDMKTRWGTCNIRTKRICLNLQLIKKHPKCLEYVVVHELIHLLEKSHNNIFKSYMDKYLPDWRAIRKELNGG